MSTSEVWLEKDSTVKVTSDPEFKTKCSDKNIFVDFERIAEVRNVFSVFFIHSRSMKNLTSLGT